MSTNSCDYPDPRQVREVRPTRRSVSGKFAFRGVTSVSFESTLERDFLLRLEFFTDVVEVIPQPLVVPFTNPRGRAYTYTPDFLVYRRASRPELVEVKPASEWRQHAREWFPKWKAARRLARERDWTFRIFDESRIRDRALENIRFLQRYQRMPFPDERGIRLVETVASRGAARVDALLSEHAVDPDDARRVRAHLWHLVAVRTLDVDITGVLDDTTELRIITDG